MTVRRAQPRTVFEELLRQQDRTYEEIAQDFEKVARQLGEHGVSISARHLRRLASGERTGTTPATRRVLQAMFNRRMDELLQSWPQAGPAWSEPQSSQWSPCATPLELLASAAQRAHEFALLSRTSLTSELMEQVSDDVRQLARTYSHCPLPEILGRLVTAQDTLFKLIEAGQAPACARELYFLAGVTCSLLARAAHDLGDPYAALTLARTGFICADRADHNGLRAAIRAWQAIFTYWADRPLDAVRYSQSGTRFASAARSTTLVWVPCIEARAWAQLGNDGRAYELVQHAERMRDQVRPDELDELGGVCTFDRSRQLYVTADALCWLPRRAKLCRRYCEEAVAAYQDTTSPTWSFAFQAASCATLAIARIGMGELDGAAEAMACVFELAAPQRINLVVKSVRRVHSALSSSPLAGNHPELAERIRVFADSQLSSGGAPDYLKPLSPQTSLPHPWSAAGIEAAIGSR